MNKTMFRQGDVTKALKGAVKAGLNVQSFEIDRNGKIVVITDKASKQPETEDVAAFIE
jgi:hypothetical protein